MSTQLADDVTVAESIVFSTLPETGFETMTEGGVEFVLCASALTAQM
ncbi:hypothetical protein [Amycolatopsis sp. lyj-109]